MASTSTSTLDEVIFEVADSDCASNNGMSSDEEEYLNRELGVVSGASR